MSALRTPSDDHKALLAAWTVLALDRMPYLASILYSLRPVDAPGTGTFAVDRHHRLYADFAAVETWGPSACSQALLHEAMHLVYGHADEAEDMNVQARERETWNLAADAAVNDDLRDAGCGYLAEAGVLPGKIGCEDYRTASHYLAVLRLRIEALARNAGDDEGTEDEPGSGQPGDSHQGQGTRDGSGSGTGDDGREQDTQPGDGSPEDGRQQRGDADGQDTGGPGYQGCGSGSGAGEAPWELPDGDDLGGQAPPAGPGEKQVIRQSLAQDVLESSKQRGDMPGGLAEWAEKTLEKPKVPWRRVLAPLIRRYTAIRAGEYDSTYARRNRRRPYTELLGGRVVNPGTFSPVPRIVFVRDTSGSMSAADLNMVGAEIESVAGRLGIRDRDLMVIDTDTEAYLAKPYRRLEDLQEVQGRGGTDIRPGIAAAAALKPSVIIVATDGYTPWDQHPTTRIPVVTCLIGQEDGDGMVPPEVTGGVPKWIRTVVVEPDRPRA